MPNVKRFAARLEPEDPNYLYSASDCGKFLSKLISKPSRVYSIAGTHKPSLPLCTGPTHQWEARTGTAQPPGQSDTGKVSNFNPPTKLS